MQGIGKSETQRQARFSRFHFPNIEFSQVAIIGIFSQPEPSDVGLNTS